jgi:hypothetical protein
MPIEVNSLDSDKQFRLTGIPTIDGNPAKPGIREVVCTLAENFGQALQ